MSFHSYLVLLHPVYQILHLYPRLALLRQVPDERVLEQHLCVGPLVVVLDQDRLDEALELGAPPLRLESRRGIPGGNCIKIGLPGKLILRDYFQENRTSRFSLTARGVRSFARFQRQ